MVAVEASASLETVVAVVAGLLAGVPVVPVPADVGVDERRHLLVDSGAVVWLATSSSPEVAPDGLEVLHVDVTARWSGSLPPEPPSDSAALVLYTSGTTGPPKGVVLTRAAMAADLDGLAATWGWTPSDVLVHGLPLFHVHGLVLGVLGALRVGSRLVHVGRPTPEAYLEAVAAGGSLVFGVPTVWSRLAGADGVAALRRARLLVSGSAALPEPVWTALAERAGQQVVERYGMTETLITLAVPSSGERRPGRVGFPVAGTETRVVDDSGSLVPADDETIGSLEVRGPTLMAGYLGQPEATRSSYREGGWFVTGDVASVDDAGSHRIVGRASSDLIKTGGFRVGAGEVEAALLAHPAVREAAVVGAADADLGQVIVAFVVADGVSGDDLSAWVGRHLARHKRPRRVVLVDSLPRNALGKVQKSQLGL